MTDINKQIEEEAREYLMRKCGVDISQFGNSDELYLTKGELIKSITHCVDSVIDSYRWRKVSEDEFPETDTPILCKFSVGSMQPSIQYRVSTLLKSGRFSGETDWVSVVEWKPIEYD